MVGRSAALAIVAAAYQLDGSDDQWLQAILEAAQPHMLDAPERAYATTYDARDPTRLQFDAIATRNFPPGRGRPEILASYEALEAADVRRSFGHTPCATASQMFGSEATTKVGLAPYADYDVNDTFGVNALDPTGRGVLLVGLLPRTCSADERTVADWTRIAAHLAAARRLRHTLGGPLRGDPSRHAAVDAILTPAGKLEHASRAAIEGAEDDLVAAVRAIESTRHETTEASPRSESLEAWTAMVDAQWSLVDHFERDGKRFLVAVRNAATPPPALAGGLAPLTLRERQVVGFTLLGHSQKDAAYELGMAGSTLRVLLSRALKKLGLRSSEELVQLAARGT